MNVYAYVQNLVTTKGFALRHDICLQIYLSLLNPQAKNDFLKHVVRRVAKSIYFVWTVTDTDHTVRRRRLLEYVLFTQDNIPSATQVLWFYIWQLILICSGSLRFITYIEPPAAVDLRGFNE